MDRLTLKAQLEAYRSPYEEENQFVSDFLALTDDPSAYSRERIAGHFTASAWIVNRERTHTLLTLHRKLGRWLQLGDRYPFGQLHPRGSQIFIPVP